MHQFVQFVLDICRHLGLQLQSKRCNRLCRDAKRSYINSKISNLDQNNVWKFLHSFGVGKPMVNKYGAVDLNALNSNFCSPPILLDSLTKSNSLNYLSSLVPPHAFAPRYYRSRTRHNHPSSSIQKTPIIVLADFTNKPSISNLDKLFNAEDDLTSSEHEYTDYLESKEDKDNIFKLFKHLRAFPMDSQVTSEFNSEETALDILNALRIRCGKVETCVQECPESKPSCPKRCKKTYDTLNVCESPPDKCRKPKCGRTMPPSWRR
ncbi:hypothetical protein ACJJTC_011401 [Scirpophaga incertulas]